MSVSVRGRGLGPEVNKFEQISSDDHQMSLAEGWVCPGDMPRLRGGICPEGGWVCPGGMPRLRVRHMSRGGWLCPVGMAYPMIYVMLPPNVAPRLSLVPLGR